MMSLRELLTEDEFGLVMDCMEREQKRCRSLCDRPVQGYGTATELDKKANWGHRADELKEIITKMSNEFI